MHIENRTQYLGPQHGQITMDRIKILAEFAGGVPINPTRGTEGDDTFAFRERALERFVQLIAAECAQVCLEQRDPPNLNYKPSERFAEEIRRHFGVK